MLRSEPEHSNAPARRTHAREDHSRAGRSAGRPSWSRCCASSATSRPNRASAGTCASWAWPRWATATCCRRPRAQPKNDFSTLKQFVSARLTAGTNLTVLKTTIGSAQSVAVAIDTARWPEVVGTISGDDTIFIATAGAARAAQARRSPARHLRTLNPMTSTLDAGRRAHSFGFFRRSRHLVLRALAQGHLSAAGHHGDRRHRRHRCRGGAVAGRAFGAAGRDRASSDRRTERRISIRC